MPSRGDTVAGCGVPPSRLTSASAPPHTSRAVGLSARSKRLRGERELRRAPVGVEGGEEEAAFRHGRQRCLSGASECAASPVRFQLCSERHASRVVGVGMPVGPSPGMGTQM
ncbi:hypothetical protein J6590_075666 [Homalodisca vitripennis]|nr:hypothetical protein J6590_075666 [Homalodisca vitripennis]